MKTPVNTYLNRCLLTAAVLAPLAPSSFGAISVWSQLTSGGLWSDPANWSGGPVAEGSDSTANFSLLDITGDNTVQMDAPHTLNAITFGDTATATAGGWIVANNGNAANTLTLAGTSPSVTVNTLGTGRTATIGAVIAGTTGWAKNGNGTLTLSGVNTYDAPTTIGSSSATTVLSVNSINSVGAVGGSALGQPTTPANGQINIGRNGALTYTGGNASSDRNINLVTSLGNASIISGGGAGSTLNLSGTISGSAANLVLRGAQNIAFTGQIDLGAANLLKVEAGTVTLSNPLNAFSGYTHVQGGILSVNSITAGGAASPLGTGTQIRLGNTTTAGRLAYTGAGDTTDRTVTLSGTTGGGVLDQSGTGLLKFTSDLTVVTNGAKALTLAGSTAGTGEFAGKIIDSGAGATSVTKTGTGTWTLSGANTFTGTVSVNQGQLTVSGVNTYNTATNVSTVAGVGAAVTLSVNSINSIGASSGSALGQPTTAANGQINLGRNGRFLYTGDAASSNRNFNLPALGGNAVIQNSGTGLLTLSGTITASGTPTTPADFIFRGEQDILATGQLTLGAANLLKVDVGTAILGNPANAFSGYVQIQGGSLSVNSIADGGVVSALGSGTQIQLGFTSTDGTVTTDGTLVYTGPGNTSNRTLTLNGATGVATVDQSGTGLLKFTSDLTVAKDGAKTLKLQGSTAGTGEIAGKIVDSANGATSVIKSGTGTWTLTGSNTYTGDTTVLGGTLKLGNGTTNTSLADTSTVTVEAGATLQLDFPAGAANSDTVDKLFVGTPPTQVPAGTYDAGTPTYGSYFLGTGSLTVTSGPGITLTPYETWATGEPNNLIGADSASGADPDNDGIVNLLEYATNTSPITASASPVTVTVVTSGSGDQVLRLDFPRVNDPSLSYVVRASSDLAAGFVDAATYPAAATPVQHEDTVPLAPGGRRFLRLEIRQN